MFFTHFCFYICFVYKHCLFYFRVSAFFYKPFLEIISKSMMASGWMITFYICVSIVIHLDLFLMKNIFTLCTSIFSIKFTSTISITKHSGIMWNFLKVLLFINIISFPQISYYKVYSSDINFYALIKLSQL